MYNNPSNLPAIPTTSQLTPLTVLTPLQSGSLQSGSLQSGSLQSGSLQSGSLQSVSLQSGTDSQCHGAALSSSTSHHPISSEQGTIDYIRNLLLNLLVFCT